MSDKPQHLQVCSYCGKIMKGTLEQTISLAVIPGHSSEESHGICRACLKREFPHLADRIILKMDKKAR